jgi:integrase
MASASRIKGLYLKKGWYYFQPPTPKHDGAARPTAVALGTKDLVEAITRLEERRGEMAEWQASRKRTLEEVLPRYYAAKAGDAVFTRRQREMILSGFCEVLGNPRVDTIDAAMIDGWREHVAKHGSSLKTGGPMRKTVVVPIEKVKGVRKRTVKEKVVAPPRGLRSPATVKTYTIVVKAFFNWAVEEKLISESPLKKLKRQTVVARTRVQEFLTEHEREVALAAEMPDYMRFILMFGFFAGLRDGEMLAMTPRWIWISPDGQRGTVTVQNEAIEHTDGTKGEWRPKVRELRTILMHPRLLAFLKEYKLRSPWMLKPEKELWPADNLKSKRFDASKGMTALAKRCGVRKLNYHILRHSYATHLVMKGVSLADVAGLLGDTLQVTQDHYAGYSPSGVNHSAVL